MDYLDEHKVKTFVTERLHKDVSLEMKWYWRGFLDSLQMFAGLDYTTWTELWTKTENFYKDKMHELIKSKKG